MNELRIRTALRAARPALRRIVGRSLGKTPPLSGHPLGTNIEFLDDLSDEDLLKLNDMLDWNAFVVDSRGRRFGAVAWGGKRNEPQPVPDPRITLMHQIFDLSDKHVLEIGCFEGIHTAGLLRYAKSVTAVDSRVENVVKTIVRTAFFGYHPKVFTCNVEEMPEDSSSLSADALHHVGVLYHLKDPVAHLLNLGKIIRVGVLLDTHYCMEEEAVETYETNERNYRFKRFIESGIRDAFSGMYDHSKWMLLDDIIGTLRDAGFREVVVCEPRVERNGPRVLLIVRR